MTQNEKSADAELVARSRRGNREAFGQIVRRYQGMVSGVIYSVCGNLHQSEDLAQETFLSAWKSLSGMKEPEKLSPWLCQIARRKAVDFRRGQSREKNRLTQMFQVPPGNVAASPPAEMLAEEEREMLWRVLSELPQPYRETMVLFYRQGQSTAAVALATGATEDAVRQRLTRGRGMLREQMAQVLERNLERSGPGADFAVAVLLALQGLTPQAATATLGAAAKGSAAIGGGGVLSWISWLFSPALALLVGLRGARMAWRSAQSARERRFIIVYSVLAIVCIATMYHEFYSRPTLFRIHTRADFREIGLMVGITAVGVVLIRLGRRHWNAIRLAESPAGELAASEAECGGKPKSIGLIAGIVVSSLIWMFDDAWQARDFQSLVLLTGVAIVLTALGKYCWRSGSGVAGRVFTYLFIPISGGVSLIIAKWRMAVWLRIMDHDPHMPTVSWSHLVPMGVLVVCMEAFLLALLVRGKHDAPRR